VVESAAINPDPPIPDWLTEVGNHAAQLLDASSAAVAEVLVSYYPSDATIGWRRDAPVFGDVVGVSLEEFIAAGTAQPITWPRRLMTGRRRRRFGSICVRFS
jgi:hypothetical protein